MQALEKEILWQDRSKFAEDEVPALRTALHLDHSLKIVRWLLDILAALGVCATLMVVHGDIKAQNIMILLNGKAVLIDFGASRFLDLEECSTEQGGGTNGYLAPESFHTSLDGSGGQVSHSSDAFALVLTAGEVISGYVSKIVSAVAPKLFAGMQTALLPCYIRPTIPQLTNLFQKVESELLWYASGGPDTIQDLMSLQSSDSAVASCRELENLHMFVMTGRLWLNQALKVESFPDGWDMRAAWTACDSVGVTSDQLFQFMWSVRYPIWDQEGWQGDVLPGIREGLDLLDQQKMEGCLPL